MTLTIFCKDKSVQILRLGNQAEKNMLGTTAKAIAGENYYKHTID